ncbi:divalent metal cation transporter [Janibacter anophelis]|uniref:divalent metal cation transporter n=1 Tax=Janibacter anophelis TaxID=319054 RepID=UPI0023DD0F06|nr:divalent metal cation transporter [Janibacter anophelis]
MAAQLEPLLGAAAPYVFALGLFAAGLTSAVAGPLGAAYAICGVMGWGSDLKSPRFRAVWIAVMAIGMVIALTGVNPIQIIILAQAANGLLLPIVAGFLLVVMSRSSVLGRHTNGPIATVLGVLIFLVVTGLALYQFADIFGMLPE